MAPSSGTILSDLIPFGAATTALLAFAASRFYRRRVMASGVGPDATVEVVSQVDDEVGRFFRSQLRLVGGCLVVGAALLWTFAPGTWVSASAFAFGAMLAGWVWWTGARSATAAGARVTEGGRQGGVARAMLLAARGGLIPGLTAAAAAIAAVLAGVLLVDVILERSAQPAALVALIMGASVISLVFRIGGGIYTKASDIGADLGGKIEAGMNEDDPSNPAAVADTAGDVIGGVIGSGVDLFESFLAGMLGAAAYAVLAFGDNGPGLAAFVVAVGAIGLVGSLAGLMLVNPGGDNLASSLSWAALAAAALTGLGALTLAAAGPPAVAVAHRLGLGLAATIGVALGWTIGRISEWFTSDHYKTVKEVARQSQTGDATLIIGGLAAGMRSAAVTATIIASGLAAAFAAGRWAIGAGGGMFGIVLAAVGAVAPLGIAAGLGAFAAMTDTAAGVAALSDPNPEVRQATSGLAAVGAAAAAGGRGYTTGIAAVVGVAVLALLGEAANFDPVDLVRPPTLVGMVAGAIFPLLFTSFNLNSVGRSAARIIGEVRRQLDEIPGLRQRQPGVRPDAGACAELATSLATREVVAPSVVVLLVPIGLGFISREVLSGFLLAAIVTGFLQAIFLVNTGGVWTGANRLIEAGAFGGSGSDSHRAGLTGDSVGDPLKDAAGPALNVALKTMAIVAVLTVLSMGR
ncbi:MAG: sodium/proton-translocating pyrophosphatase [Actinomycetota bacterium]